MKITFKITRASSNLDTDEVHGGDFHVEAQMPVGSLEKQTEEGKERKR